MYKRIRFPFLLSSPCHRLSASPAPVLLDNFAGASALTDHTPDIAPAGSSWAIISGAYGNLSGGYLPYTSGAGGRAVINAGLADCELRFRMKHFNITPNGTGMAFRSNLTGADYYYFGTFVESGNPTANWGLPSIIIDPAQTNSQKRVLPGLAANNYYTWRILLRGSVARLYDESGVLTLAAAGVAKLTNTYYGPFNSQPYGSWDFIEIKPLSTRFTTFSVIGDSISDGAAEWPGVVAANHNNGYCYPNQHAAIGTQIQYNLDALTDAAEAANSDFTIILLGANDSHSFNPTAEYQENLQELWGTLGKPIYACGILPTTGWTTGERNTFNGYIQAAVANAQAAGVNVTYWSTDGWIDPTDPADTADGLHPTAAGHIKIANQVLARL